MYMGVKMERVEEMEEKMAAVAERGEVHFRAVIDDQPNKNATKSCTMIAMVAKRMGNDCALLSKKAFLN